jgi:hypothetical protein
MNRPEQRHWLPLSFHPPERFEPLEVRLPDKSVIRAVWTGSRWWANGKTVLPEAWREIQMETAS